MKDQCVGKKRYPDKRTVQTLVNSQRKRHGGMRFRPYFCEFCDGWHVSSKDRNGEKISR